MIGRIWATKHMLVILILLAVLIVACGSSSDEDKSDEAVLVSEQEGAQDKNETSPSDEDQGAPEEQASEQSSTDEEATEAGNDESPAETSGDSGIIAHPPTVDIQAMQAAMAVENLDTGETMEASYSFVQPDRFMTNIMGLETLVAGDTAYTRIAQGEWTEQPLLSPDSIENAVEQMTIGFLEQAIVYELLEDPSESGLTLSGEESLNGIPTLVYTYDGGISSPLAGLINGEVKVWIGKDDGLVYRQEVVNSTDSGLGPRSRSIIEMVYGDAVSIEVPN